jgi:hypothetical protein
MYVPSPYHQLTQAELLPPRQKAERPVKAGRGSDSVKENQLHVDVYMLQDLVLHLDVSAPQELEVHLDVYSIQYATGAFAVPGRIYAML